jgi:nucleotide-binding universal stress UspA family protein
MSSSRLHTANPTALFELFDGHGGGSFGRVLVPVAGSAASAGPRVTATVDTAAQLCVATGGQLRVVHVRLWDPPVRNAARFYPETSAKATEVLQDAVTRAWAYGIKASGVVVEAQRSQVARAIIGAARDWRAEVICIARPSRAAVSKLLLGSVPDQVIRHASCPVLLVRPEPAHRRFIPHVSH